MPERSSLFRLILRAAKRTRHPFSTRGALPVLVLGSALLAAACTEEVVGGGACPVLCPQEQASFRDTVIEAIAFDSTIGPFPVLGVAAGALVAERGDTLSTHVVLRFDALPNTFGPNGEAISEPIVSVDSSFLRFVLDTSATRLGGGFTLEAFNVDTTESDSVSAVVQSLFRPDRKIGEVVVPAGFNEDSLRVRLDDDFVGARMVNQERLRVGLRIVPTSNAQLRIGAFVNGEGAPRLTFDAEGDTTYIPLDVTPNTRILGAETDDVRRLAYTVYTLVANDASSRPPATLAVGGLPATRAYYRFAVPRSILDSSTVVRAELVVTQRPAGGTDRGDSVGVQPLIGVSRNTVTDIYLATALAASGQLLGVDSLRLVPMDSGERSFNIVNVVRAWASQDSSITRFIALRLNGEGFSGARLQFHDRTAAPALRPRLRITYLPRSEFALP